MKWYSLRVISGKEKSTKENILFEAEAQSMADFIDDIFVPFEKVIEMRNNKKKVKFFKKYIINYEDLKIDDNLRSGIITPDKDIVDNAKPLTPAYIVFDNYDLILKWNRSLRFALAVCKLKNEFKNEL